ncbi:MAG: hypothetical protein AYL28_003490 [Candidatus Bathyarchaeota archaeon B23]|nr:MAG: hypothetical protein AYL28_003490 [Candidatus Bathyarchaeota archaeon B23]
MRVIVLTQGHYGERIYRNISQLSRDWSLRRVALPPRLPTLLEEPEELLKSLNLSGGWDLLLFLGESPSAATLIPEAVRRCGVGALIAPADRYSWLPLGLERQISDELGEMDVEAVFPRPFCSLRARGLPLIDRFAESFGAPELSMEVEGGMVRGVEVLRGAPCGSTWFMAERLPETRVEEAAERAGLLVQIYPCLASRDIEPPFNDAPIHVAAHLAMRAVEKALGERAPEA